MYRSIDTGNVVAFLNNSSPLRLAIMTLVLIFLPTLIIGESMASAYRRHRDTLHPIMFVGPMLIYIYSVRPLQVYLSGDLGQHLTEGQINFASILFSLGIFLFCRGCLHGSRKGKSRIRFDITPAVRRRLVNLGAICGVIALIAYWYGLWQSGGFFRVYSQAKGRYSSGSGWINEMVNLSIPAAALFVLSWHRERRHRRYLLLAFLFASPLLVHGILGARRGPTFIILSAMLVAWYITSPNRISFLNVILHFGAIGLLMLFLVANRQQIYLGSNTSLSWDDFSTSVVSTGDKGVSDDTVFMYGMVNTTRHSGTHHWGLRYLATYLIRPIPRQIWPTKYEDIGMGWLKNQKDLVGIPDSKWKEALGWVPVRGSAPGFVADLYLELSWIGLIGCFLIGKFYGWMWFKASQMGGLWTLLFIEAAALSVYVPTQSVSAVFHRFLVMSVPTFLLWRHYIGKNSSERADPTTQSLHKLPPIS